MGSPQPVRRRRKSSSSPIAAVDLPKAEATRPSVLSSVLKDYGSKALALAYGLFAFTIFALRGFWEGCVVQRPSHTFWQELAKERQRHWDLSTQHPSGLNHAFWTLTNGLRLHYLTNAKPSESATNSNSKSSKTKHLLLFFHGWPDTCSLWTHTIRLLPATVTQDCTLVAVDLPGFGGSDGFDFYGPNQVLQAITEYCIAMREQYLDESANGQVIFVSFDWGAVIGFRLAAEAPEIADRFIMSNSALSAAATKNIRERAATAFQMLSVWTRSPLQYNLLLKAYSPLKPVFSQLGRSAYIFIFLLPWVLAEQTITRCNLWLLRVIHSLALGFRKITDTPEVTEDIAGFLGPIITEKEASTESPHMYGASVIKRSRLEYPFSETIRYYREGLGMQPWEKNLEIILKLSDLHDHNTRVRKRKSSHGSLSSLKGALGAPTTIVWGDRDPALDHRIMLEGIDEYLPRDSQVIRLPRIGHWVPRQGEGPAVLATVIEWAVEEDEKDRLAEKLAGVCATARISVSK